MALDNPLQGYMQMAAAKERNRQQAMQDAMGIGQNLGQLGQSASQILAPLIQKKKMENLIRMMQQGQGGAPGQMPTAGIGGVAQNPGPQPFNGVDQSQLLSAYNDVDPTAAQALMGKMVSRQIGDPRMAALNAKYPQFGGILDDSNVGQLLPSAFKPPPKPPSPWAAVPNMTTKDGNPLEINKETGEIRPVPIKGGTKVNSYANVMGPIRERQYTIQDLPSNQPANTAGGAAYQVLVASQQGMNLIARAGSVQRTALATGDLARAILRNAPTDEALRNANFSENVISQWGRIKQQLTADPKAIQNPKIRREIYDIFKEMRASSRPFIENQLRDMRDTGFTIPDSVYKRQLGDTIPVIPFQEGTGAAAPAAPVVKPYTDKAKEKRYQEYLKANPNAPA